MPAKKYEDRHLFIAFDLARTGASQREIAKRIGIDKMTMIYWLKNKPLLRLAIEEGKKLYGSKDSTETFTDYVYKMLPKHLKKVWEKMERFHKSDTAVERIDALFAREGGKNARQHLWVYAYCRRNFNASRACRAVGISIATLNRWKLEPGFAELIEELHEHKKNFFEDALVRSIKAGEVGAITFANRTINRDRGYADKMSVEVSGKVDHNHQHQIKIEDLDLPIEVRKIILEKMEEYKARLEENVIDVPVLKKITQGD